MPHGEVGLGQLGHPRQQRTVRTQLAAHRDMDPAKEVQQHLRFAVGPQPLGGVGAQVAQQPVVDRRRRASQSIADRSRSVGDPQRVDGGEQTDGVGGVGPVDDAVGAAVGFQRQQRRRGVLAAVPSPPGDGARGSDRQQVAASARPALSSRCGHIGIGQRHGDDDVADPVGLRAEPAGTEDRDRRRRVARPRSRTCPAWPPARRAVATNADSWCAPPRAPDRGPTRAACQPASSSPSTIRHDAGSKASTCAVSTQHTRGRRDCRSHTAASIEPCCGSRRSTELRACSATASVRSPSTHTSVRMSFGSCSTSVMVARSSRLRSTS